MKSLFPILVGALFLVVPGLQAQNRIQFNGQDLFLSGANLAWRSFANDIGPNVNTPDTIHFANVFNQIRSNGGNSIRLWLHTTGEFTPAWSGSTVTGPGSGTIEDLRRILDLAWERKVGMILCLWSFDMLRTNNGAILNNRARNILTNDVNRQSYIANALVPMVQVLQGHPAIVAWEIFNEPEGMSNEFGWEFNQHVPMAAIQRFINQCAGAIHRTDPAAKVSNGSWSFYATTDVGSGNFNYYTDARLIAAGGDPNGYLDFYMVHYYDWAGTVRSPFHQPASYWGLDKPLVVAEFYPDPGSPGCNNCGGNAYQNLYQNGYAGALAWSWTDVSPSRILAQIAATSAAHPAEVLIVDSKTPAVSLTSPANGAAFPAGSTITMEADASDPNGTIARVEFFQGASKLGEDTLFPYQFDWVNPPVGIYALSARVTDNTGLSSSSVVVNITVGNPTVPTRYEAEAAAYTGDIIVGNDGEASGGHYLDMTSAGDITFNIGGVSSPGTYSLAIRFRLFYDSPKTQNIIANGGPAIPVVFSGAASSWLTTNVNVSLKAGNNQILLQRSWGWMYFDYIELQLGPSNAAPTDVTLSNSTVAENQPPNTVVGSLSTTDPNSGNTFAYSLVNGTGSADNASFTLNGPSLRTSATFDHEARDSYSVRIRSTDQGGLFVEKAFTINVMDVNEPPTLTPLPDQTVDEETLLTFTASATDPDLPANILTFTLEPGAPAGASIHPTTGVFTWTPTEAQGPGSYPITVRVTDNGASPPNLSALQAITVVVNEVNATPAAIRYEAEAAAYTGNIIVGNDGAASGGQYLNMTSAGDITFNIDGVSSPGTYTLTIRFLLFYDTPKTQNLIANGGPAIPVVFAGPASGWLTTNVNVSLNAGNNQILIQRSWGWMYFDYVELQPGPNNDAPTDVALSNSTVAENQPPNTVVGSLSTTDPNSGNTFAYSLVNGTGSADNGSFTLSGLSLRTSVTFDHEARNSYSVRIRSTDQGGLFVEKAFTINVTDVNEPPTLTPIPDQTVDEETLLTFTARATDPDLPANTLTFTLEPGAPAGASIHPTTGVFTWIPTEAQGPSTNFMTVKVEDNGSPSLSVTNSFTVVVREVNTQPKLTVPEDRTLQLTTPFNATATAIDADEPVNTLTFSLVGPTNASIHPTSGVISWTPTFAQLGTNVFTVQVTDDGAPSLNDTKEFRIIVVRPESRLGLRRLASGLMEISTTGDTGFDYELQASTNVVTWEKLFQFRLSTTPFPYVDSNSDQQSSRFYRLKLIQQ